MISATQCRGDSRPGVEGQPGILRHADRRRVDHAARAREGRVGGRRRRHAAAEARVQAVRQLFRARLVAVSTMRERARRRARAARGRPPRRRRRRRAAGRGRARSRPCSRESSRQSPSCRCCGRCGGRPRSTTVLTAPIAAASGDEVGQERHDALLERMGDVEAGEAELLRRGDDRAQRGIVQAEPVEIDQPVGIVEPEPRAFALVHDGRARRADASPDQADQHGCACPLDGRPASDAASRSPGGYRSLLARTSPAAPAIRRDSAQSCVRPRRSP